MQIQKHLVSCGINISGLKLHCFQNILYFPNGTEKNHIPATVT